KQTLLSIISQNFTIYEVIIVDQSDDTLTKDLVSNFSKNNFSIKYIHSEIKSLTIARNIGIENLSDRTELVIFLDDDVVLENDYINKVNIFFENDNSKKYFGATGYIKNNERKSKITFLLKLFILQEYKDGKFKINGLPTFPKFRDRPYEIEFLSGCNMIFRKEIFNEFKFDENMLKYCYMEDVDFTYRVSRKFKMIFLPDIKLIHNVSPVNRLKIKESKSFFMQNYLYLFKKNVNKNLFSISSLLWSISGMFFISLLLFQFKAISGYFDGIIRYITKNFSSLKIGTYK
ncbi:MAG TPA: glycosyltransferase, partial [Spirochaetota bacterium]|nr:glycosyltransferase [Spirochaetota bacterium]